MDGPVLQPILDSLPAKRPTAAPRLPVLGDSGALLPALFDELLVSLEAEAVGMVALNSASGEASVCLARGDWQRWNGMKFTPSRQQSALFFTRGEASLAAMQAGSARSPLTDSSAEMAYLCHVPLDQNQGEASALWLGKIKHCKPYQQDLIDRLPLIIACTLKNDKPGLDSGESLPELVDRLSQANPGRYQHSLRMIPLMQAAAGKVGLAEHDIQMACWAALLHDIGEISIPAEILDKAGPLDDGDWSVVRLHPGIGARMLPRIKTLIPVREIIHTHHEHYNGSGYPLGLAGEMIPPAARLLAIVDAFTAMTEERPYRHAYRPVEAAARLEAGAGTQFDPAYTRAFLSIL